MFTPTVQELAADNAFRIASLASCTFWAKVEAQAIADGNLENGDHLLAVGDVRLWGMGAEQVASILRQAGQDSIRLIVARPVDPTAQSFAVRII